MNQCDYFSFEFFHPAASRVPLADRAAHLSPAALEIASVRQEREIAKLAVRPNSRLATRIELTHGPVVTVTVTLTFRLLGAPGGKIICGVVPHAMLLYADTPAEL